MLTFLRRIRKQLMESGTVGKYLIYAIGEIFLVVIGILIALQINNWNEARKLQVQEKKIIKEIKHELEASAMDIKDDLEDHQRNQNSTRIILNAMLSRQNYHDSLMYHLRLTVDPEEFTPKTSAFESLKSIGLEILSTDSMRRAITDMYQLFLPSLGMRSNEFSQYGLSNELTLPLIQNHVLLKHDSVEEWSGGQIWTIKDYKSFINDELLKVRLQRMYQRRKGVIRNHREVIREIEKLLENIDKELVRIE